MRASTQNRCYQCVKLQFLYYVTIMAEEQTYTVRQYILFYVKFLAGKKYTALCRLKIKLERLEVMSVLCMHVYCF